LQIQEVKASNEREGLRRSSPDLDEIEEGELRDT